MSLRAIRWSVWSVVVVSSILGTYGVALQVATGTTTYNLGLPMIVLISLFVSGLTVIGAVIISWHPRNLVGWALFLNVITWVPQNVIFGLIASWLEAGSAAFPGFRPALLWLSWTGQPFMLLSLTVLFLHFPSGRLPSPRWRPVVWAAVGALLGTLSLLPLQPRVVDPALGLASPFAVHPLTWANLEPLYWLIIGVAVGCLFAATGSLTLRFRRSRGVERQQLKWIAYSAVPVIVSFTVVGYIDAQETTPFVFWSAVGLMISLLGMGVAIAVAIFRYRLYDIDLIINRSLVYGALSLTLAAIYFGSVAVFQNLIGLAFGQPSPIAIVASTLVVAALFHPLRRRLQQAIDRRFYRARYDGAQMLEHFGTSLSGAVDVDSQADLLLFVVDEALQPSHTSLWVRSQAEGPFAVGELGVQR